MKTTWALSFLDPNYNHQARRAQSAFFCSKPYVPEEVALMGKGSEFLCEQPLSMASGNLGPRPPVCSPHLTCVPAGCSVGSSSAS